MQKPDAAKAYRSRRRKLLSSIQSEYFTKSGRLAIPTVTAQALSLCFGIAKGQDRKRLAAEFNQNVLRHECRVTTGFIGTPYLLFALWDNGFPETAQKVLMNGACSGWLYEVDMGATTVWERWNGIRPDGSLTDPRMNSMNHYANGAVMEFVWRRIAGIEPLTAGFKKIKIAPRPVKGLPELNAEFQSVNGTVKVSYRQSGNKIKYRLEVPKGIRAEISLLNENPVIVGAGSYTFERACEELSVPPYTPESFVREVFDNPKAVEAFNRVFGGIFTGSEIAWMYRDNKTLQFMAEFRDSEGKMRLKDFPAMLKKANELFMKDWQ